MIALFKDALKRRQYRKENKIREEEVKEVLCRGGWYSEKKVLMEILEMRVKLGVELGVKSLGDAKYALRHVKRYLRKMELDEFYVRRELDAVKGMIMNSYNMAVADLYIDFVSEEVKRLLDDYPDEERKRKETVVFFGVGSGGRRGME